MKGLKLGLPHQPVISVYKEIFDGVDQAIAGTPDLINGTYIPNGVLNGAKALELWYSV